ncbi:MAG: hypothetical protein SPL46_09215, partial [Selenomonadaceae bacterium]|nr:hypothetical protein [Selenomonadaceae bacterium]
MFMVYVCKDTLTPSVKNKKIVIAWILLSGIVLVGGMRLGLVPAWQGQESYETLEYVEGRCEYIRRSKLDPYRYYIYGTQTSHMKNMSFSHNHTALSNKHYQAADFCSA